MWIGMAWLVVLIIAVFVPVTVVYFSNTGPATQIANVRQISIVSQEDIERIALAMGISEVNPQLLGANFFVTGCNDFRISLLLHGSSLVTLQRLLWT